MTTTTSQLACQPEAFPDPLLQRLRRLLPGIVLCVVLAALSYAVADWPALNRIVPLSALTVGILVGVFTRLCVPLPAILEPGIKWVMFWILRAGIVLLGFELVLEKLLSVGAFGLTLVVAGVASTIVLSITLGRLLRLPDSLSTLLGCGTGICGASAIVAVDGVVHGHEREVACAIALVTFFGTLLMFGDPILAHAIGLSEPTYSAWAGSSIHEVAQAVAAGFSFSAHAGIDTSLYKLSRVALLAPACAAVAVWWQRRRANKGIGGSGHSGHKRVAFPLFVVLFMLVVVLNSAITLPADVHHDLRGLDTALLATAMVAVGLQTRLVEVLRLGWRPVFLGAVLTLWLSGLTLAGAMLIGSHAAI